MISKLWTKAKNNWQISLLIVFLIAMIYPYCYLAIHNDSKFYSPDEMANYTFTKEFAENSRLYLDEPLNSQVGNLLVPRSINIINERLVPVSFVGLPIMYGLIAKVFGLGIVPFLTPIIALTTCLLFYHFINLLYSRTVAFWSSLILLFNPVFWYSAGKGMLHNTLFLFWLLLGFYLLLKGLDSKKQTLFVIASSLCVGFSLWVRSSEITWVCLLLLITYIFHRKQLSWKKVLCFVIPFLLMIGALLQINYSIYENIFRSGYSSLEGESVNPVSNLFKQLFIPFGFNLKFIWLHFYNFVIKYLWFFFVPALLGLIYYFKNIKNKFYPVVVSIVSLFLLVFYGSYWLWGEYGQAAEPEFLIGGAHLRYWLPILVLATPFIVLFFAKWKYKKFLICSFVCLLIVFSFNQVFYDPQEGFLKIRKDVNEFFPRLELTSRLVPENAVLIVPDWADRIFFPEYNVIFSLGDSQVRTGDSFQSVKELIKHRPVYLYSASSPEDINELKNKFTSYDLNLEKVSEIYKGEKLYLVNEPK